MATALKKAPAKKAAHKAASKAKKVAAVEPRKLNRVGSLVNDNRSEPATVGERMSARRLQLNMTQAAVAELVVFTPKSGKRDGEEVVLSRNAYCMYETGGVEPDLQKIEEIARALQVSPQWLAFGIAEDVKTHEFIYDASKKTFVEDGGWSLSVNWLKQQFSVAPQDIGLFMLSDYSENFVAGDLAIFEKNAEPSGSGGTFIFAHKGEIKIAHVTRPPRSENLRIFSTDLKTHDDVAIKNVAILGRVIGKIGSLERN